MSCVYCEGKEVLPRNGDVSALVYPYGQMIAVPEKGECSAWQIAYCPMCGAPLGEQEPLTLDELREMDGMPVYATSIHGASGEWTINDTITEAVWTGNDHFNYSRYSIDWLAYRHPPKEDA